SAENIEFRTLDVVTDPVPEGDLCIIRQVFQHLSNRDITTVLQKCRQYRLLVVTDEQVVGDESNRNADIAAYHGTRRVFGHGLKLERAPFFEDVQILLRHSSGSDCSETGSTYLRTVLLRNNNNADGGKGAIGCRARVDADPALRCGGTETFAEIAERR